MPVPVPEPLAAPAPSPAMTAAEFLEWADRAVDGDGYELFDGVPVAMAKKSLRHAALVARTTVLLSRTVTEPFLVMANAPLSIPDRPNQAYRPDLMVVRAPEDWDAEEGSIRAPQLIVEVLSPSTMGDDLGRKLDDYELMPSVRAILFVYTEARRVKVVRRTGEATWAIEHVIGAGTVRLDEPRVELPLDEVYGAIPV